MPREVINEVDVTREYPTVGVLAWGWDEGCAALLHINYPTGGATLGLEWGDLERLNKAVRRAMKSYRKRPPSLLPTPEREVSTS